MGASLTSVLSRAEDDFLKSLMRHPATRAFWTCGRKVKGVWKWLDGNGFCYTNWMIGRPGFLPSYACLIANFSGHWTNSECNRSDYTTGYICKYYR